MAREKALNPAAAQRKADKQREIARSKKQVQAQRNEKLARRNPERVQKQIDELKSLEQQGILRPKDRETLTQLEKDVRAIRRAQEAQQGVGGGGGNNASAAGNRSERIPAGERKNARQEQFERRQQQQQHLGKRRRGDESALSNNRGRPREDVDPEVLKIPMPRDTPPPFPHPPREDWDNGDENTPPANTRAAAPPPSKKVYSSAPQIRDLRKEAVRFMPAAVSALKKRTKGEGKLLEPEELDRLEQAGYYATQTTSEPGKQSTRGVDGQVQYPSLAGQQDMDHEMQIFERELSRIDNEAEGGSIVGTGRAVTMEEVEDEDS